MTAPATNASSAHASLEARADAGNEIFHVFLGVAFVAFVAVVLCSTIVGYTVRELGDWAQRTARAEQQLSDPLDLVGADDEYGDVFRGDAVPLSACRL